MSHIIVLRSVLSCHNTHLKKRHSHILNWVHCWMEEKDDVLCRIKSSINKLVAFVSARKRKENIFTFNGARHFIFEANFNMILSAQNFIIRTLVKFLCILFSIIQSLISHANFYNNPKFLHKQIAVWI